jgi:hypothetical protein
MTNSPWTGMVPVDDTALAVTDTGGTGTPVVYLNGAYAGQRHWKPTIAELAAGCAPVLECVACPVRYVLATGDSLGSRDGEQDGARAALDPVLAKNPNLTVSAKVASDHGAILRKDFRAIAQAIREIATAGDRTAG